MSLTTRVLIGLSAGLALGIAISRSGSATLLRIPVWLDPVGSIWVNAMRMIVVPLVVSAILIGVTPASHADVAVTTDQRVTIDGEYPSLEQLIEDLSWRAGFELRSFGLEDRMVDQRMTDVPLDDALRRLVGRDLYTVGLSVGADGVSRVTWVEIPGPREPMGARKGVAKPRAPDEAPFQVPPKLFLAAFESTDPAVRAEAWTAISRRVLDDPVERERFIATDVAMFVDAMKKYPDAVTILRGMASAQSDSMLRSKLEQVIAALEGAPRAAGTSAP